MYLIYSLPYELNDNVLITIGNFDLAIFMKRFWVAGQLYQLYDKKMKITEKILIDIVRYLDIEKKNSLLGYTSEKGYKKVVAQLLADNRVDPSVDENLAIRDASYYGHLKVVDLLLRDPRVNPSADDNCAIRWASENGHLKVVKKLLSDPRIDPSARNNEAICMASYYGHFNVVKLLLSDPRVSKNAYAFYNYAIRWASYNGHNKVVKFLERQLCHS